jgi:hypothetical protein
MHLAAKIGSVVPRNMQTTIPKNRPIPSARVLSMRTSFV